MKRAILTLAAALAAILPAAGQSRAYEYQDELESAFGPAFGIYKVTGEQGKALGSGYGEAGFWRYTHYFSKHYGAFLQLGIDYVGTEDTDYFGAVNKADGGRYLYRRHGSIYSMGFHPAILLGGAYRLDWGNAGFRARAALGYGGIQDCSCGYMRAGRDDTGGFTVRQILDADRTLTFPFQ